MKDFAHFDFWRLASPGWVLALVLLLAGARPALAQIPTSTNPYDVNPTNPQVVRPDTATVRKISKKEKRAQHAADSAKRTERLFGLHLTRPEKAGMLALIPSGGQIYNKKYWKLPIVYGMVGGLGYWVWFQQHYYSEYKSAYQAGQKPENSGKAPAAYLNSTDYPTASKETSLNNVYNNLTGYRSYRDLAVLISALGYSLTILDAVVDAHLHDFDVSDNLSMNCRPTLLLVPGQLAPAGGLALTLRVK
ncbi:hypothetical protein GCM10023172_05200 [Hymenobacter ginsengisoli]|uniref:DUF5683 domain-containing protein n=1 Tax=Hymenobacter ginsengisoli TaxID=1051626 RepID=A0ABP8PYK8_9BACT|nr:MULTISPECIES: DUF5683 domain-containing protein [unclassified Hymenobacter]MBO2030622.1 hypothetical protein [Hymenobacter sp. BT559]